MPKGFHEYLLNLRNESDSAPETCSDNNANHYCKDGIKVGMMMLGNQIVYWLEVPLFCNVLNLPQIQDFS